MIDTSGRVFLIEANTNPCLEMNSPLLARLIPTVLDNTFKLEYEIINYDNFFYSIELQSTLFFHHLSFFYGQLQKKAQFVKINLKLINLN